MPTQKFRPYTVIRVVVEGLRIRFSILGRDSFGIPPVEAMKDERTSTRTLSEYFETAGALFNGTNLELSTSRFTR